MRTRKHYVQEQEAELAKMSPSVRLLYDLKLAHRKFVVDLKNTEKKGGKLDAEIVAVTAEWKKKKNNKWMPDDRLAKLIEAMHALQVHRYVVYIPANTQIHGNMIAHATHAHAHVRIFTYVRQTEPN